MTLVLLLLLLFCPDVFAHPGGLDKNGCHRAGANYKYADGRVIKKGDYHCHRKLDAFRLDGRERLQDDKEAKARKEVKK